jgi:preprotein translocase subunit YajC
MELLLPFALVVGVMWLMTSRTRKQQRAAADFRANLEVGQEVMTGSGLYGTIVAVDGDTITLESTPGNRTRWIRAAIAKLVPPVEDDAAVDDDTLADEDSALDQDVVAHDTVQSSDAAQDHGATRADRIDVPDDLSTLDERRRPDGPEPR